MNCALVSWRTNRTIAAKEPEKYLSERRLNDDPTDSEVRDRLSSHLIPYDEMVANDYDAFLEKRADIVHTEMLKLCD